MNYPPAGSSVVVTGQLVKVRKLSSRIAFADLVLSSSSGGDDGVDGGGETIELVIKERGPTLPTVKEVLRAWKLGDVVSVPGQFETRGGGEETVAAVDGGSAGRESDDWREHRTFLCGGLPRVVEPRNAASAPFRPVFTLCRPCADDNAAVTTAKTRDETEEEEKSDELCKYYTCERRCPRGESCKYVHTDDAAVRRKWYVERRRRAVEVERLVVGGPSIEPSMDAVAATTSVASQPPHPWRRPQRRAGGKARRAEAFASVLVDNFDLDENSLVLDVAGGRGDLCFELSALRGVPCVSVDPRGRKLSKRQRVYLRERNDGEVADGGRLQWGGHVRRLFFADFFDAYDGDGGDRGDNGEDLRGRVTLIVGLHPDEATEHIVDCALRERIAFAVVPCCVFPISGGSMSFGEWCDYLQAKDGRIRRDYIDCMGKNLVLHCTSF